MVILPSAVMLPTQTASLGETLVFLKRHPAPLECVLGCPPGQMLHLAHQSATAA
jgi:hypothetical protein